MPKWAGSELEREAPKFPAPVKYVYCECTCADFEYRQDWLYEHGHFASRFVSAQQVQVSFFEQDKMGNITAQTVSASGHVQEGTMTFDSGEPSPWICKHIICAVRLWVRAKHKTQHVLIHWQGDLEVVKRLKWAKHQQGDSFQPIWYRLDRNVFIVGWNDVKGEGK